MFRFFRRKRPRSPNGNEVLWRKEFTPEVQGRIRRRRRRQSSAGRIIGALIPWRRL